MIPEIRESLADGVLTLTLYRQDKKNALTNAMYGALADALAQAEASAAIRVVLIEGEGDLFTSGNDVGEFAAIAMGNGPAERHVGRFLHALAEATKPIVAAVQGKAVGVGTTMLLHCDMVLLADDAQLIAPFINLALVPEAASSLLMPARIGHARAFELFALGEPLAAAQALAWGLANKVVPAANLRAEAKALALKLAAKPGGSLTATKQLMRNVAAIAAQMEGETQRFQERLQSPEALEAFTAFAQRRAPVFNAAT